MVVVVVLLVLEWALGKLVMLSRLVLWLLAGISSHPVGECIRKAPILPPLFVQVSARVCCRRFPVGC